MEDDILSKIVEVEKEIQERLEIEKNKAHEWLEKVKKDAEKELITAEKELNESLNQELQDAKQHAEKKASEILLDAQTKAERLEKLSDEILKTVILKHIIRILPYGS
mgnify:FL=1